MHSVMEKEELWAETASIVWVQRLQPETTLIIQISTFIISALNTKAISDKNLLGILHL